MIINNKKSKFITCLTTLASILGLGSIITISADNQSLPASVEARDKSKYSFLNKNKISINSNKSFKDKYTKINNHLISKQRINNAQYIYQYLLNNKYLKFSKQSALAVVYISYSETGCSTNLMNGFINWNNHYQKEFLKEYSNQQYDLHSQLDFFMKQIICKHSAKEQSELMDSNSVENSISYIYHNIFNAPKFAHTLNEQTLSDVQEMIKK